MAGRPQENSRTGKTYKLAEFLNKNWDRMVGRTNDDVAIELGFKSGNMVSMWRTGKTRVALERLPDVANLMHVDLAVLLPMWFEQYMGDRGDAKDIMNTVFKRLASQRETALLNELRDLARETPERGTDPIYSPDQIMAIVAVTKDEALRKEVLKKAVAKGVIDALPAVPAIVTEEEPEAAPEPKRKSRGKEVASA